MNPMLSLGNKIGKPIPEITFAGLIAAMLTGEIPMSTPGLIVCAVLFGIGSIAKVIEAYKSPPKNPKLKLPKNLSMILFMSVVATLTMSIVACESNHALTRPDSLVAAFETAKPYISGECRSIGVYPGYELVFDGSVSDPEFTHGFGGIVGGCDSYAKVRCLVNNGVVACEAIGVLVPVK